MTTLRDRLADVFDDRQVELADVLLPEVEAMVAEAVREEREAVLSYLGRHCPTDITTYDDIGRGVHR